MKMTRVLFADTMLEEATMSHGSPRRKAVRPRCFDEHNAQNTPPPLTASPVSSDESCCLSEQWKFQRRWSNQSVDTLEGRGDASNPCSLDCIRISCSKSPTKSFGKTIPCPSPISISPLTKKRRRSKLKRRNSTGDCTPDCSTLIMIHVPPANVMQMRIIQAASFLFFVYLLCLMRFVVDSQKHTLRLAKEVEETLEKEKRIADEATKALKELELEFADDFHLPKGSAGTAWIREQQM